MSPHVSYETCPLCGYEVPTETLVSGMCGLCYDEEVGLDGTFEKFHRDNHRNRKDDADE